MSELWTNSGYQLLVKNKDGYLDVTDDLIRAYLARPELVPIEESCDQERKIHGLLMDDPSCEIDADDLNGIADKDTIENYQMFLGFRDKLYASGNIENFYFSLIKKGAINIPPLFIDNLVHLIIRNILEDLPNVFQARAGELFFREQMVAINEGAILLADSETVETKATVDPGMGNLGRLVMESGAKMVSAELDVLNEDNRDSYLSRSDNYDMVLDITFPRDGLFGLCHVMQKWIAHFLHVDVSIVPVQKITDEKWVWHTGLDKESSSLLNDLYEATDVAPERMERLLSLFRLEFKNPDDMQDDVRGKPVYMGLCVGADKKLNFKPQNLLFNLPLANSFEKRIN